MVVTTDMVAATESTVLKELKMVREHVFVILSDEENAFGDQVSERLKEMADTRDKLEFFDARTILIERVSHFLPLLMFFK